MWWPWHVVIDVLPAPVPEVHRTSCRTFHGQAQLRQHSIASTQGSDHKEGRAAKLGALPLQDTAGKVRPCRG